MLRLRRVTSLLEVHKSLLRLRARVRFPRVQTVSVPPEITPPPPRPPSYRFLLGGLFSLFWRGEKDEEDSVPLAVKSHLKKAQRALRNGDYDAADRAYHRALKRLVGSEHANAQAYIEARAVVLDKLANLYLEQGQLEEVQAEVTFKEAMRYMLSAGMEQESEAMVEISLKLSKIYTNQKKFELAKAGFEWCTETAEKIVSASRTENTTALWGMCLHSKAQFHLATGDWQNSILCLSEALTLSEDVFGSTHTQVAVVHNDLATALDAGGEYGQAEFHARSSIEIMLRAQAEGSSVDTEHLTRVYYNLGNILIHNEKRAEARDILTKALRGAHSLRDAELKRNIKNILEQL